MNAETNSSTYENILKRSSELEGAMGAVAFAVLEMFRLGGMKESEVKELHEKMKIYFMKPSNSECNAVIKMVETRLQDEKEPSGLWYH